MTAIVRTTLLALLLGLSAAPRAAAEAAVACGASPPPIGARIRGPVLQVIDARTVCVALGPLPQQWLALRLRPPRSGGDARSGPDLFAQTLSCRVTARRSGAVLAACDVVEPQTLGPIEAAQLPF